ncbi:MAG: hypothetical protein GY716_17555 [bacterium]|nr:hypothetical protein [bacterium]
MVRFRDIRLRRPGTVVLRRAVSEASVRRICAGIFFASGFAALVYQVIWQRMLAIFSGVHIQSVAVIVTAFMAGLGVGSLIGGRIGERLSRRTALVAFAACELAIGLFGLISPWLYYDLATQRLGALGGTPSLAATLHVVLLLPPTLIMGASLPLLVRALVPSTERAAGIVTLLYGVNTLGAGAGALLSAWYLIGVLGLERTVVGAAGLNVAVAGLAGWLALRAPLAVRDAPATEAPRAAPSSESPIAFGGWCLVFAYSGFVALSLELVWFRVLDVAIKSSPYTFGHLLGLFLIFVGLGSLVGAATIRRVRNPGLTFLWIQWAVSATAGVALLVLTLAPLEPLGLSTLARYWNEAQGIELYELLWALEHLDRPRARELLARMAQVYLMLPVVLLGVPALLMGFGFACIQRAVHRGLARVPWRVGALQASNIAGAVLGSSLTGLLLFDRVGTATAAAWLVGSGIVFGGAVLLSPAGRPTRALAAAAVSASLILAGALPSGTELWARLHGTALESIDVMEDASGVAAVQKMRRVSILRVNGRAHSLLPYGDGRLLLGLVPTLIHPGVERAAVVGLGMGTSAWAIAASPALETVSIYEIVRPELDVLAQQDYPALARFLDDPRVSIRFSDGRIALRTGSERFDLIEADGLEPSMAYSGNLYSREFFDLCRSRLRTGGIFVTYVPTARTLRTLAAVFPHVLDFHADDFASFALGSEEPFEFDPEQLGRRMHDARFHAYLDASGEIERVTRLVDRFLDQVRVVRIDSSNRPEGSINTDLFPRDEFDKSYSGTYH